MATRELPECGVARAEPLNRRCDSRPGKGHVACHSPERLRSSEVETTSNRLEDFGLLLRIQCFVEFRKVSGKT